MDTLARRYRTGTHQHSGLTNYQVSCGCVRVPSARRTASTLQNSGTQHSSGVPRRRGGVRRHAPPPHASADSDDLQPTRLGPNVAASIKDVKERLTWSPATVIRNEAVNLDGTHRLLHLSVSDEVDLLYGRRIQAVPDTVRWIESFTVPGQFVGVRAPVADEAAGAGLGSSGGLYTIACSPYESRRESAYIGASIIEVVVDKGGGGEQAMLADLAPGAAVEVSQVVGRGFASLFNSYCALPSCLEEQRNMLAVAVGVRGIAAIRAALNWAPVQAHASSRRVSVYYVTRSPSSAAFLAEWDAWREAGVTFHPLYTEALLGSTTAPPLEQQLQPPTPPGRGNGGSAGAGGANGGDAAAAAAEAGVSAADIMGLLDQGLFLQEHGIEGAIGGPASEAAVLLAGVGGALGSAIAKELTFKGVAWERLLFCDYF